MMNKMMKKIAIALTAATLTLTAVTPALANDGMNTIEFSVNQISGVKTVIADEANVRTEPSMNGRILKALPHGSVITVSGVTNNGWYEIITSDPVNGGETAGYIAGNLLADTVQPQPQNGTYTTRVNTGYLALRNGTSYDPSNEIGPLWNGSRVTVIGDRVGDYVPVRVDYSAPGQFGQNLTGCTGYVNANYLIQ